MQDDESGDAPTVSDIRRIDRSGNDTLLVSIPTPEGPLMGFVRVGPDHYVTFLDGFDGSGEPPTRLDVEHGVVTTSPIRFTGQGIPIPTSAAPDGTIYGLTASESLGVDGNRIFRLGSDGIVEAIAGDGLADSGTRRQLGQGGDLHLSAVGMVTTLNGNLLIASGHVVYRMIDPAEAPTIDPIALGSPTNFIDGPWAVLDDP